MNEIVKPSMKVYWIADNGIEFIAGATEPHQTTSFGSKTGIYWQGHDRNEYELQCVFLNIKPHDHIEETEI